tara:strand:+ start:141 stop:590 length:450 start_codon:yes stop_codon:yes gene_type:complete
MASLLTSTETTNLVGILGDVFDTFKRDVVIHKSPKKVISQINESQLFGYGEAANPVNYTYTPQSGVYSAKISYIENKANEYIQDFQSNIDSNLVRMKVQGDAKDYIESGTTENITFDDKTFNLLGDHMVKNFLGPSGYTTYVYYLKETK